MYSSSTLLTVLLSFFLSSLNLEAQSLDEIWNFQEHMDSQTSNKGWKQFPPCFIELWEMGNNHI